MAQESLIDVAHVSARGSSLRITIPRKVAEISGIKEKDIVGFYQEDGKITVRIMK
jgi:bifunctional DNA-binding transcriptional regulator/antitoxin component of YhaV-PrlF toxin-antitoxin module